MTKFTPGPWVVETYELDMWGVYTPDGELIADCGYEQEANARLIAAAPEMYKILCDLREYCKNYDLTCDLECDIYETLARIDGMETPQS